MSTPLEFQPPDNYTQFPPEPTPPVVAVIDPDNPPWGVGVAAFAWLSSIALLLGATFLALIIYFLTSGARDPASLGANAQNDPKLVLLAIVLMIPAHVLTLAVVWAIVTNFGKRPFRETVGWSWSPGLGLWSSVGLAILLFIAGSLVIAFLGKDVQTPLEDMLESSPQARFATAFLATFTAPLVEELVYRGVLYPALQRAIGALWAVLLVASLFTLVHYEQYYNNPAVLGAVGSLGLVLTIVRARTGRVLPCIVIHLVFNGIQCVLLILDYFGLLPSADETKAGLIVTGFGSLGKFFPGL